MRNTIKPSLSLVVGSAFSKEFHDIGDNVVPAWNTAAFGLSFDSVVEDILRPADVRAPRLLVLDIGPYTNV